MVLTIFLLDISQLFFNVTSLWQADLYINFHSCPHIFNWMLMVCIFLINKEPNKDAWFEGNDDYYFLSIYHMSGLRLSCMHYVT